MKIFFSSLILMSSLLTTLIPMSSQAGFLLEPYVNYTLGSGDTTSSSTTIDYSTNGPELGARLGFTMLGLMGGIDAAKGTVSNERKSPTSTLEDEYSRTRVGVFAGYDAPILVRGYVAYHFVNTLSDQENTGYTAKNAEYKGSALEFGLGFTPLPLLSVNVGYRINTFDEYISPTDVTTSLNGASEISINEIFFGVSLPLDL